MSSSVLLYMSKKFVVVLSKEIKRKSSTETKRIEKKRRDPELAEEELTTNGLTNMR